MSRWVLEREERGAQATVRIEVPAYMRTWVATASAGRLGGAPNAYARMYVSGWIVIHQPAGWWRHPPRQIHEPTMNTRLLRRLWHPYILVVKLDKPDI
nr:hypothetical protein [Candidatus Njordarchaeota archaeon]